MVLKAVVIYPKKNPLPRHELVNMVGAKAKTLEGKRNELFPILWDGFIPELGVYVAVYDNNLLNETSVLEGRSMKNK